MTPSRYFDPGECPNCGCLTTHRTGACEAAERDDPWEPTEGPGSGDDRYGPRPATETAA